MGIFKKLFGKKKNPVEKLHDVLEENDIEMEVTFDSEQDLKDEDYKYTTASSFIVSMKRVLIQLPKKLKIMTEHIFLVF